MWKKRSVTTLRKDVVKILSQHFSNEDSKKYERYIYGDGTREGEDYNTFAFEKIGELVLAKDDEDRLKKVVSSIKKGEGIWDSITFEEYKRIYESAIDKSVKKPTPVKGAYICKKKGCGSDLFYTWSLQTRSSDEGMTHFRECAICGDRGKQN
jgi:DNA-directed RNA polymerase subunit M/transcription elongation factor TFIIS